MIDASRRMIIINLFLKLKRGGRTQLPLHHPRPRDGLLHLRLRRGDEQGRGGRVRRGARGDVAIRSTTTRGCCSTRSRPPRTSGAADSAARLAAVAGLAHPTQTLHRSTADDQSIAAQQPMTSRSGDCSSSSSTGRAEGNPFLDVELSAQLHAGSTARSRSTASTTATASIASASCRRRTGTWTLHDAAATARARRRRGHVRAAVAPTPGNHGPVRVADTYHFAYADGTRLQADRHDLLRLEPPGRRAGAADARDAARLRRSTRSACASFPSTTRYNENEPRALSLPGA